MFRKLLVFTILTASLSATSSKAIDLFVDAVPQAQNNTCQSYASVLALAAKGDPAFPVSTFAELRQLEADFRAILESLDSGTPYTHTNWPKAMEQLTGGVYTFKIEYKEDIVAWMSNVREATTMSDNVSVAVSVLTGKGFDTVLTSVDAIDGSQYGGHIVTILGVAGSGVNSETQLIAFNSAIKGHGGSVNMCSPGNQPGDKHYRAGVVETQNFQLRTFPGFLLMRLQKK
ncbi:MAG: hypothetical protein AB2809_19985 [Candidatus Thiodiazotropha sp.]